MIFISHYNDFISTFLVRLQMESAYPTAEETLKARSICAACGCNFFNRECSCKRPTRKTTKPSRFAEAEAETAAPRVSTGVVKRKRKLAKLFGCMPQTPPNPPNFDFSRPPPEDDTGTDMGLCLGTGDPIPEEWELLQACTELQLIPADTHSDSFADIIVMLAGGISAEDIAPIAALAAELALPTTTAVQLTADEEAADEYLTTNGLIALPDVDAVLASLTQ